MCGIGILGVKSEMSNRQSTILDYVTKNGFATATDLAKRLNVSAITVRRDFKQLEAEQKLQRVHGGAVPADTTQYAALMAARMAANVDEKKLLAAHAVSLLKPRQKVFLDAGSTCYFVADAIPDDLEIVVITHSIDNINVLRAKPGVTLIGLGGEFESKLDAFVGPTVEHQLAQLRANIAFLSAMSIDLHRGTCDDTIVEHGIKCAMNRHAEEVHIIVDSSKFSHVSLYNSVPINEITNILTTQAAPSDAVQALRRVGINVEIVPAGS